MYINSENAVKINKSLIFIFFTQFILNIVVIHRDLYLYCYSFVQGLYINMTVYTWYIISLKI